MNTLIDRFNKIKSNILTLKSQQEVKIIAVSKTFPLEQIRPLLDFGHINFGIDGGLFSSITDTFAIIGEEAKSVTCSSEILKDTSV